MILTLPIIAIKEFTICGECGYIGDVVFDGFGKEVVRTTDAIYYAAAAGVCNVTGDLSGYTVSLIETRNIQQPAEALIIYKQEF